MTAPTESWPRLGTFPASNARIACGILLIAGTGVSVMVARFLEGHWDTPPETWLGFLLLLAAVDTTHFYLKRRTAFGPTGTKTEQTSEPT